MHSLSGGLVLGYHGCDAEIAEKLLGGEDFLFSGNPWDWLGPGAYFWEANPRRGYEFAVELKQRKYKHNKIENPAVVGAVINPGLCLDLATAAGIEIVRDAHRRLVDLYEDAELELPRNETDLLRRNLDCAVIEFVHGLREIEGDPSVNSVRGVFIEGGPIYESSGFYARTHIQIAIRNPNCIKGVFRVAPDLYK
jgi:hypothetical protein